MFLGDSAFWYHTRIQSGWQPCVAGSQELFRKAVANVNAVSVYIQGLVAGIVNGLCCIIAVRLLRDGSPAEGD